MGIGRKIQQKGAKSLTAFEVVQVLFMFGGFIINLIGLCYLIFKNKDKK